jgi:hypothetical protein
MNQTSLAAALANLRTQVAKIGGETTGLVATGPTWSGPSTLTVPRGGTGPSIASYATRPALQFRRIGGTAPAGLTISAAGVPAADASVPPGTYTVIVEAR